jgi:hypothetical protein
MCEQYHKWCIWYELINRCQVWAKKSYMTKTINQYRKCSECNIMQQWVRCYKDDKLVETITYPYVYMWSADNPEMTYKGA